MLSVQTIIFIVKYLNYKSTRLVFTEGTKFEFKYLQM